MKFISKYIFIMAVSIAMLSGCHNQEVETVVEEKVEIPVEKPIKKLVYGSGDYTSINPALYEHGEINPLIFSGLTSYDKDNNIVPDLAESWEFNKKTNTYTFKLRQDVKWHDGEPFTAKDVKYTLYMIMKPENGSEIVSNYEEIQSIVIIDDYTIKIALNSPNVAILDYLTVGILPMHCLVGQELITNSYNQMPIGTGPFKIEKWDRGQSITLVKNEEFYGDVAKLDKVIFKIVADDKAKAIQLKSGELDLAQITPKDTENFKEDIAFNINKIKTADYRGIIYNFNNSLFKENRELPKAFSYAIDKQKILDGVLLGNGSIAYSPLQVSIYNNSEVEKYEYNPEKAKELIESMGWVLNEGGIYEKDLKPLAFTINCMEGDMVRIDMANVCVQELKAIGVNSKVEIKSDIDWENQEAFLAGWGSPFDPDDNTYKVFGTDKASNNQGYSNEKVDELLKKARETEDKETRINLYKEFQHELTQDLPMTFLAYIDAIYISKKNIVGMTPETILGHHGVGIFWNIEYWDIKEEIDKSEKIDSEEAKEK